MTGTDTLSLFAAIAGLVGAVGGLFAAMAAFRSAGSARAAVEQSVELERRRLVGLVVEAAQKVETEYGYVTGVAPRLKRAYQEVFTFANRSGNSLLNAHLENIEWSEEEVAQRRSEASDFLAGLKSQPDISEEELADLLHKFNGYAGRLRVIKIGFQDELASVERQNDEYRKRIISSPP